MRMPGGGTTGCEHDVAARARARMEGKSAPCTGSPSMKANLRNLVRTIITGRKDLSALHPRFQGGHLDKWKFPFNRHQT